MSESYRKFGFSAGVLSEALVGRSDLEKYDLGLRSANNWVVDPLGGLTTRPGFEFLDYIQYDTTAARLQPFKFNSNIENTYAILFEANQIRFLQDGAYVLEDPITIISTAVNVVTVASHSYLVGEWLKIDGQTLEVDAVTATTFTVSAPSGATVDLDAAMPTSVQRIYTIASPYASADLATLVFKQTLDELVITHVDYPRKKLTRLAANSWTLTDITEALTTQAVTNLAAAASGAGTAGVVYAVAAVDSQGRELPLAADNYILLDNIVNFASTAGQVEVTWDAVAGAAYYNVYRSYVATDGASLTVAADLGFLGKARAPQFLDTNIIPDFSIAPLEFSSLFVEGGINSIEITAPGTGYARDTTTVSASGGGSGFEGLVVVDGAGTVIDILILNPGSGYSSPTLTISGAGASATATATATDLADDQPACVEVAQQRRVYAGTTNNPNAVFGSRTANYDSFSSSGFARADDPYVFSLDQEEFTPIRHMARTRNGLFLFAANEIAQLRGIDDAAIKPGSARALPQTEHGIALLEPLPIESQFLYLTASGGAVRSLRPSNLPTYFTSVSVSRLIGELLREDNTIVRWAWTRDPHRLIWGARADGTGLALTFDPEVNVEAWTEISTQGAFEDFIALEEFNDDVAYAITRRYVNGTYRRYIERSRSNHPEVPDDMWAVDAGLQSTLGQPAATITLSDYSGTITVDADAPVFSGADIGKHFRAQGGFGVVTQSASAAQITVELYRDITQNNPNLAAPADLVSGKWSLTSPSFTFSGLDHLEGCTVEILADGSVLPTQVVTNGAITLTIAASQVLAGLGYTAEFSTLPPAFSESGADNLRMQFKHLHVRFYNSREPEVGDGDLFYAFPDTGTDPIYDLPANLRTDVERIGVSGEFDFDARMYFRKVGPVHVKILGYMGDLDFESD